MSVSGSTSYFAGFTMSSGFGSLAVNQADRVTPNAVDLFTGAANQAGSANTGFLGPNAEVVGAVPQGVFAEGLVVVFETVDPGNIPVFALFEGGPDADSLVGDEGASAVYGYGGDDELRGAGGDDRVIGGEGDDALHGDGGDDELYGSDANDALHGGVGSDSLDGGFGDDALQGDDGDDILLGRDGDDTLTGGLGFDQALWTDRTQPFTFLLSSIGMAVSADGAETDRFAGVENIVGTDLDDTFLIDANYAVDDDAFVVITPGFGRDVIVNAGASVIVDYSTTDGGDPENGYFSAGVNIDLAAGTVESVNPSIQEFLGGDMLQGIFALLGTVGRDHFSGTDLNDFLIGGDGVDVLEGRGGDDVLAGGAGNGQVDGGDGFDMVDYFDAEEGVVVNLVQRTAIYRGVDQLTSIEDAAGSAFDDILIGDGGSNFLLGGDGDDKLDGRAGDDFLEGGLGDDVYWVDSAGDQVFEDADGGRDRINTSVDFFNAENVESLVGRYADHGLKLIGNGLDEVIFGADVADSGDRIDGVVGNDIVRGFAGDDYLNGGAGDDILYGELGDDILRGGAGQDRVVGGAGADRIVHRPGDGYDRVGHFNPTEDMIDLTAHGLDAAGLEAALSEDARGVLIDLGGINGVLIYGVALADFGPDTILL